jgi:hypothetical protein
MQTAFTLPMQSFRLNENQDAAALAAISKSITGKLAKWLPWLFPDRDPDGMQDRAHSSTAKTKATS